jgi:hypothetical protein
VSLADLQLYMDARATHRAAYIAAADKTDRKLLMEREVSACC